METNTGKTFHQLADKLHLKNFTEDLNLEERFRYALRMSTVRHYS